MSEIYYDEIVYCALCGGHGKWEYKTCPACGGVGKFDGSGGWTYCNLCKGHGTTDKYIKVPCPACGGKGKVGIDSLPSL